MIDNNISARSHCWTIGIAIYDLYGLDIASLNTEADQWTVSSLGTSSVKTTTIGQVTSAGSKIGPFYVIGGPGVLGPAGLSAVNQYFERTYTGLVPHTTLRVYLEMFFWGTAWDTNVFSFSINVDGSLVGETYLQGYGSNKNPSLFLGRELIKGTTSHSANTVTLRLINLLNINSDTASFGFHNVTIYLSNATASPSFCQTSMDNTLPAPNQPCTCMKWSGYIYLYNQTKDASGTCADCSANCKVCSGTASSQCMLCNPGYVWTGDSCWDGICDAACTSCWGPGSNSCSACQAGYYNYGNGTCSNVCSAPYYSFNSAANLYCQLACPITYYAHENRTCSNSCSAPYYSFTDSSGSYCQLDCPNNMKKYSNYTCLPIISSVCSDSEPYYYPDYNACKTTCYSPYTFNGNKTCTYALTSTELAQATGFSDYMSSLNQISFITSVISIIVMFSDPSSVCLISLTKLLFYIRYMDINYPPLLQTILDKQKASSDFFTFFGDTLEDIKDNNPNKYLPWVFRKYNLSSTFLISFWTQLYFMLLLIILILLSLILEVAIKRKPRFYKIFKPIQQLLMWNFFISRFMTYYDEIIFFGSLDFRTNTLESTTSILSFLVALFMTALTISIPSKLFHTFHKLQEFYRKHGSYNNDPKVKQMEKEYGGYSMLFEDFKRTSFSRQSFLSIYLIRMCLFYLVISYLFKYPLVQALLNILLNLLMIVYVIRVRPFRQKWNQNQYIMQEVVVTIVNICILILALLDKADSESTQFRYILGWIIIVSNIIFSLIGICVIIIVVVSMAKAAYKFIKQRNQNKKAASHGLLLSVIKRPTSTPTINHKSNITMSPDFSRKRLEDSAIALNNTQGNNESFVNSNHNFKLHKEYSLNENPISNKFDSGIMVQGSENQLSRKDSKLRTKATKASEVANTDSGIDSVGSTTTIEKEALITNQNEHRKQRNKGLRYKNRMKRGELSNSRDLQKLKGGSIKSAANIEENKMIKADMTTLSTEKIQKNIVNKTLTNIEKEELNKEMIPSLELAEIVSKKSGINELALNQKGDRFKNIVEYSKKPCT